MAIPSKSRSSSSALTYPTLSFVNINNPEETKLRSKKRAVRSHVAYYQHHKHDDRDGPEGSGSKLKKRGKKTSQSKLQSHSQSYMQYRHSMVESGFDSSLAMPWRRSSSISIGSDPASRRSSSYLALDSMSSGIRLDPFNSYPVPWKEEYNPIIDFYVTQICVDIPQIAQEGKMFLLRTLWFPFIMNSPKAFYAALALGSAIYHFRHHATQPTSIKSSLLDLRHNAIISINQSLSDPLRRADDFTIAAVFCMCCLESLYGDSKAYQIHMSGLAQMVHLRGGLENLALEGLMRRMIVWLDFNHASRHGSRIHFDQSTEVSRRPSPFKYDVLRSSNVLPESGRTQR